MKLILLILLFASCTKVPVYTNEEAQYGSEMKDAELVYLDSLVCDGYGGTVAFTIEVPTTWTIHESFVTYAKTDTLKKQ